MRATTARILAAAVGATIALAAGCAQSIDSQPGADDGDDDAGWQFDPSNPDTVAISNDVVGVALHVPSSWTVFDDPVRFRTHGFVLTEASGEGAAADDPEERLPVARIALDYDAAPGDLERRIAELEAEFPEVPMTRTEVRAGGRPAVAVGPVPGGIASTAVFLATDDALYRISLYRQEQGIDRRGRHLLDALELVPRRRTVASLHLLDADSNQALYGNPDGPQPNVGRDDGEAAPEMAPAAGWQEYRIAEGCWAQPSSLFIQTTHSRDANGNGWSQMGTPNFWGERTHGNWGLGRCVSTYYTNDLYAIDYYLDVGDRLYSPFADGYVTYAGWDPDSWWNYGNMVVIATPGGKYWSLSGHMSHVNVWAGEHVDRDTLIGWAGSTGYAAPYSHVHQAYYRWASTSYGRPYGGAGMMPTALRFIGHGGGTYFRFFKGEWASW